MLEYFLYLYRVAIYTAHHADAPRTTRSISVPSTTRSINRESIVEGKM
jgi:hypothetical protein